MKIYGITGYKGRLGSYLLQHYSGFVGLKCDVINLLDVERCLKYTKVDGVLHLASKSDVEWCEKNQKEASNVNLRGLGNVAHIAQMQGIPVVLLSSDHVFNGNWKWWSNRENDKGTPVNHYGWTKLGAESLHKVFDNLKVIRTSYLFDGERLYSELSDLRNRVPNLYPTFISRSFMYLPHFAMTLCQYLDRLNEMPKILNISGTKIVSWFEFMREVGKQSGIENYKKLVVPRTVENLNRVPRPHWGGLNVKLSRKLGLPQWSYIQGISEMLK